MSAQEQAPYEHGSDYGLSCGSCGHRDHLELFCKTPIGGELPIGSYQCPSCTTAWRVRKPSEGEWSHGGQWSFLHFDDHPDAVDGFDSRLIFTGTAL